MTAFLASLAFVGLAEMGDKTQLATISLAVKWGAALIFIAFGVYGLWENLPREVWSAPVIVAGAAALAAAIMGMSRWGTGRAAHETPWTSPGNGQPNVTATGGSGDEQP